MKGILLLQKLLLTVVRQIPTPFFTCEVKGLDQITQFDMGFFCRCCIKLRFELHMFAFGPSAVIQEVAAFYCFLHSLAAAELRSSI